MTPWMPTPWGPSEPAATFARLPTGESIYEIVDARFGDCIDVVAQVEHLTTGLRWAEGPVYFAEHRALVFSDTPNARMMRFDEATGAITPFRYDTGNANGNTRDHQGRLITCEQGAGRVTRTEPDGRVTILADSFEGGRFNGPNDVVVGRDGAIWFTDPSYGRATTFVGVPRDDEIGSDNVYRIDPADGSVRVVADDFVKPNGLAFSPDESRLYIVDSGYLPDVTAPRHIRVFDVGVGGRLSGGEVLCEVSPGIPDGLRVDSDGRLWVGAGDGVHCIDADGTLLGKIRLPEACANVAFGGPRRDRLYMTATTSLYAVFLNVHGAQRP